jgi:hypothetical protein
VLRTGHQYRASAIVGPGPPPHLGEHMREVLGSLLGLGSGELDRLAMQKII